MTLSPAQLSVTSFLCSAHPSSSAVCVSERKKAGPPVSEANADILSFSVFGLCILTLYAMSGMSRSSLRDSNELVSLQTSIGLLIIYVMYIYFQLFMHSYLYSERGAENGNGDVEEQMLDTTDMEHGQRMEAWRIERIRPLSMGVGTCTIYRFSTITVILGLVLFPLHCTVGALFIRVEHKLSSFNA